jgi:hypothetical protein
MLPIYMKDSKSAEGNLVGVRFPLPAPNSAEEQGGRSAEDAGKNAYHHRDGQFPRQAQVFQPTRYGAVGCVMRVHELDCCRASL